jgi:type I restriction enzyme M protein
LPAGVNSNLIVEINSTLSEVRASLPELVIGDLQLDERSAEAAWSVFADIDGSLLDNSWAQDVFMRFGPKFLKKDLDQYFTPTEIVDFVCGSLDLSVDSKIIDPAGGSADFLTGAAFSCKTSSRSNDQPIIHYWDQSEEASTVARLNLWISGVQAEIAVKDSIEKSKDLSGEFDFCITNPPFGTKTIWAAPKPLNSISEYQLGWKPSKDDSRVLFRQQLGILFIERGLNLLRPKGILAIVLPSGYMSNPSEEYLRSWLLENHRVLGVVSLPAGTFKKSGAGVSPDILFVQKGKTKIDYEIFMAKARSIGFDFKKKDTPKIFLRDPLTGAYNTNPDGSRISANDLRQIQEEFAQFASTQRISGLRKGKSEKEPVTILKSEVEKTLGKVLSPNRFDREYLQVRDSLKRKGAKTLSELGASLAHARTFRRVDKKKYTYLDIGEIGQCSYKTENVMMGWELPARAKHIVHRNDVLVSRLAGSSNKFCLVSRDHENLVATNGLFIVRIPDKTIRLTFLAFLFSREYRLQFDALATGSIMEDVKEEDFLNEILIPVGVPRDKLEQLEAYCDLQSEFISNL